MRRVGFWLVLAVCGAARGQDVVTLPAVHVEKSAAGEGFRFVSDGPAGTGWGRPDEIPRKYFNDALGGVFERTLALPEGIAARTRLVWMFTGPRAGFTVELSGTKVRLTERYYDSMGLYGGQGNFPEKTVRDEDREYVGTAQTLTVVADSHLAVRVLVNGVEMLREPMLFDVTRHQLIYQAPRTSHDVVEGRLLEPEVKRTRVTINEKEVHQTMLGFGGSPSIPAFAGLSEEGKRQYWAMLKRYNLLLSREYPMGSALKPDLSNLATLGDASPHYYGDNFPNGEVSDFDYSKHVLDMGGSVIYEMWALPEWATEAYAGTAGKGAAGKGVRRVANVAEYVRIMVGYCRMAREKTGAAPIIVGVENEVDQPPAVFDAMVLALRRGLDEAGFAQTKIHMADASYMFLGIERAKELRKDAAVWKAIDYAAVHEYDFQEFMANPDRYDERMHAMREASGTKEFLATEICFNDPHYQDASYRVALVAAELYHKNLTELDAVALMYCWLILDIEQPTFGGSRSLLVPDRVNGSVPVASSFELRALGAYSRHIRKGMRRIGASTDDADLMTTAFADQKSETLILVNRGTIARRVELAGGTMQWVEMERTGLTEANAVSAAGGEVVVQPGEIVTLSTLRAD